MSRRDTHESSLDLLLDTICNMFGMIIFIAVLAAVLASARGEQRISQAAAAVITDTAELESLQAAIEHLERQDDSSLRASLEAAEAELDGLMQTSGTLATEINRAETLLRASTNPTSTAELKAEISMLEAELQSLHELHDIALRTPRRRLLKGRVPVQVVLTKDRFYLINDWSGWRSAIDPVAGRCAFWGTWNEEAVDPVRSLFEDHGTCGYRTGGLRIDRVAALRPGGGIDMHAPDSDRQISALLSDLVRKQHVVSFRVTPDSFDQFHAARRLVVGQGLEYDVKPISSLGPSMQYRDLIRMGTATGQ